MPGFRIFGDITTVVKQVETYGHVTTRLMNQVLQECADKAKAKTIELLAPYADSGRLINSVQVRPHTYTTHGVSATTKEEGYIVTLEAPYAQAFMYGTQPSPGRYVPAIGRRLTARGIRRSRRLVRTMARRLHMSEEIDRAIRKVPVMIENNRRWLQEQRLKTAEGLFYHPVKTVVDPRFQYGQIFVRLYPGSRKTRTAHVIRHELWHAVQRQYYGAEMGGRPSSLLESEAETRASFALAPIGMHPGTKGHMQLYQNIITYIHGDLLDYAMRRLSSLV